MLTGSVSKQKYRIIQNGHVNNHSNKLLFKCETVKGIFDQQAVDASDQNLQVRIICEKWQNFVDLSKLGNQKIKDWGEVPNSLQVALGVPKNSKFVITECHGPTLKQVRDSLKIQDVFKIGIEMLQIIRNIHQNGYWIYSLSEENIAFQRERQQGREISDYQLILTNFDHSEKSNAKTDAICRLSDLSRLANILKSLRPDALLDPFTHDLSVSDEPNYAKLIFLLKLGLVESANLQGPMIEDQEYEAETNIDEKERGKRPSHHHTVNESAQLYANQYTSKYKT